MPYPPLIEKVIFHFSKLPGVGRRSAERMAFWVLGHSREEVSALAQSIVELKENLKSCRLCNNFAQADVCMICSDSSRDQYTLCVVEDPKDVLAIEKTGAYKGQYHVLMGNISPADGRGPEDIKIGHLVNRVQSGLIKEVVIATDPDNEGEMTSLYIIDRLKDKNVKVSRIGLGIPMGSSVEFSDMSTLCVSFNSRRKIQK